MRIFVPSRGRSSAAELLAGPTADFSYFWTSRTIYVVPVEEVLDYEETIESSGLGSRGVRVIGVNSQGIAATRHAIGIFCREHSVPKFAMVDDDVRFVRRISDDHVALKPCEKTDVDHMWKTVEWFLDHYGHVGVSARQGNNNMGVGGASSLFEENTRTLRVLCYRTDDFLSVQHGRVTVMEDFDVNLQLLRKGIKNANLGWWSQDQKMTNAPGGCSTYRTHEKHEESAHELARLHAPYVALRQKENKTGGAFGKRTEVTIYWKKAFGRA